MSETRHRYGDVREDGKVFVAYSKTCRGGEYWVTPERFQLIGIAQKVRYYEKRTQMDDASPRERKRKRITVETNPALRARSYAPRPSRRKPTLSPESLVLLPYGPDTPPATCADDLVPIPNYDGYGITPEGSVHRLTTPTVGKNANLPLPRITPSRTPLSPEWSVQLKCGDGRYRRVLIRDLMRKAFAQTNS